MTIRRQYSLPNCTLVLDGFSDAANNDIPNVYPVMSSLFNAECQFVGRDRSLLGGRDFLTSLVATVSDYAQHFMSGIHHSQSSAQPQSLVSLTRGDAEHTHHLVATLDPIANPSESQPTQMTLSTVELFDLLEAIDRFLADRRTLPDMMISLKPVTKAIAQPISAQAAPISLGLTSLVVASLVGYALPAPQVSQPKLDSAPPVVAPTTAPNSTAPIPRTTSSPPTNTRPTTPPSPNSIPPTPKTTPSPTSALPSSKRQAAQYQFAFLGEQFQIAIG